MEIILTLSQSDVFTEVAQTASYTGSKMQDDPKAYDRITTVDEDQSELQRFWDESRAEVAKAFKRQLVSEGMKEDTYSLVLDVPVAFDEALLPGMQSGLRSFFVQSITAKWFGYTNKKETGVYAEAAKTCLDEVREKALHRKMPVRPRYD
jgi:hypothetical protein